MRTLHLYELEWFDNRPSTLSPGEIGGYKVKAASHQLASNSQIRNLYNYLRANGNRPYMTELANKDIRIQYFKKGE